MAYTEAELIQAMETFPIESAREWLVGTIKLLLEHHGLDAANAFFWHSMGDGPPKDVYEFILRGTAWLDKTYDTQLSAMMVDKFKDAGILFNNGKAYGVLNFSKN
ncbi:hypothetical protein LCGC14_1163560 [marine sediment metagenome]|uniref:Uncharacterized protein n=1 Tax=marine sediment metagenome TaxID=412755 RepID=A0A0F9LRV2_9ZZZZ